MYVYTYPAFASWAHIFFSSPFGSLYSGLPWVCLLMAVVAVMPFFFWLFYNYACSVECSCPPFSFSLWLISFVDLMIVSFLSYLCPITLDSCLWPSFALNFLVLLNSAGPNPFEINLFMPFLLYLPILFLYLGFRNIYMSLHFALRLFSHNLLFVLFDLTFPYSAFVALWVSYNLRFGSCHWYASVAILVFCSLLLLYHFAVLTYVH